MKKEQIAGLEFRASKQELSLGVELELQILDGVSLALTPRAAEIIEFSKDKALEYEYFQSTIELITPICKDAQQVEAHLKATLDKVSTGASHFGLKLGSTGTHPIGDYREGLITRSPRYDKLTDRNQWIIRRMAVYGMHIHVGMPSGDACINYNYFFMHFLPHILALSASSPFWQGKNTGLAACRPTTYEALPTAGMPYLVKDWKGFQSLYRFLKRSKSIESNKDLWWDIRPSPQNGTIELRFCDQPATLYEATAIVAFVHLLAYWYRDHQEEWTTSNAPLKQWIFRENKWRAIRHGLDANIVVSGRGKTKMLASDITEWIKVLRPYESQLGYSNFTSRLEEIVLRGNSAKRQYAIFQDTNDLDAVVRHNVSEFEQRVPMWSL